MKFVLLFFCLAVCYAMPAEDDWEKYKVDFERKFEDPTEEQLRKGIYLKNKKMVEEHNKKFEKGLVSYSLGLNQFSDRTEEELKSMRGIPPRESAGVPLPKNPVAK